MLWIFLAAVFAAALFFQYVWPLYFAVTLLLIKLYPLITLPGLAAFFIWVIRLNLKTRR